MITSREDENPLSRSGDRAQLPIACTLDAGSGSERLARWRRLLAAQAVARHRHDREIEVRFAPGAAAELADLVAAERECCAFVGWELETVDGAVVLRVIGTPEHLASLALLGEPPE